LLAICNGDNVSRIKERSVCTMILYCSISGAMFPVPATAITFWLIAEVRMYIIDVVSDHPVLTPVEFVAALTCINPVIS
jgi:hypothetical protein